MKMKKKKLIKIAEILHGNWLTQQSPSQIKWKICFETYHVEADQRNEFEREKSPFLTLHLLKILLPYGIRNLDKGAICAHTTVRASVCKKTKEEEENMLKSLYWKLHNYNRKSFSLENQFYSLFPFHEWNILRMNQ